MTSPANMTIRPFATGDEEAVIELWTRAGSTRPWNDPGRDIAFALQEPTSEIFVGVEEGVIIASVMVGHDGHRGAVYYLATDPRHEGEGHGRAMMDAAEAWLKSRGVWKLNLMVRSSNEKVHGFYEALGYEEEPRTVFAKWLEEKPTASAT